MTGSSAETAILPGSPQFQDAEQRRRSAELGMWVFLASEIMFFGALFVGYAVSRFEMGPAFAAASRRTDIVLGTLNTGVLLTSSYAIASAVHVLHAGQRRVCTWLLAATALLGVAFLIIKGFEYYKDYTRHLIPWLEFHFDPTYASGATVFFYLYFVATGVHALHLSIGIGVVLVLLIRVRRDSVSARNASPLVVGGLYWHLVDIVWIFLYPAIYLMGRAG